MPVNSSDVIHENLVMHQKELKSILGIGILVLSYVTNYFFSFFCMTLYMILYTSHIKIYFIIEKVYLKKSTYSNYTA